MDKGLHSAKRILRSAAGLAAIGAASVGSPAHAGIEFVATAIIRDATSGCRIDAQPLAPAAPAPASMTKTAALLGGAPSALDAIKAQQTAFPMPAANATAVPAQLAGATPVLPLLVPGIDASRPVSEGCSGLVAARIAQAPGLARPLDQTQGNPEHFLASKRIRIARTNFDKDWKRVRSDTLSHGMARRFLPVGVGSREALLAEVNRWANQRIRYTEDAEQYGRADFWAGAKRTLKTGRGDCEDIALVKMQLLAAAGVSRDDMILTIARDLVRNADHAVLVVRTDAGYRLLDNATDTVLDAGPSHDYRAILSFGNQSSWLHGV